MVLLVCQAQIEKKLMQYKEVTGRLSSQKRTVKGQVETWYCLKVKMKDGTEKTYWISTSFCKAKSIIGIPQWSNYLQQENKIFTLEAH